MAGAMETIGDQGTEFFPALVAPPVRVWPPAMPWCQSVPYSVRPDHTILESQAGHAVDVQFTDRKGGEVLFDRICRDNAITHRLTQPRLTDHHRKGGALPPDLAPRAAQRTRALRHAARRPSRDSV